MNKGKTKYNFTLNADTNTINQTIINWLTKNNFKKENKFGEEAYYYKDTWNGNRGFNYTVNGTSVEIDAWTIGINNTFFMLDSGAINNIPGDNYKEVLNTLIAELNQLNNVSAPSTPSAPVEAAPVAPGTQPTQNINDFSKSFNENVDKSTGNQVIAGFIFSIIGLLAAFLGLMYGLIMYVFIFYIAIKGLKTSKKNLAIASLIITGISIAILLYQII